MQAGSKPRRDWIFNGFLSGSAGGFVIGYILRVCGVGDWKNSYLLIPFLALLGGLIGLSVGSIHRFVIRRWVIGTQEERPPAASGL